MEKYSNREIDLMMKDMHEKLDLILTQTTKTNGRVTRLERAALIVGTAVGILLVVNGSPLLNFLHTLIK